MGFFLVFRVTLETACCRQLSTICLSSVFVFTNDLSSGHNQPTVTNPSPPPPTMYFAMDNFVVCFQHHIHVRPRRLCLRVTRWEHCTSGILAKLIVGHIPVGKLIIGYLFLSSGVGVSEGTHPASCVESPVCKCSFVITNERGIRVGDEFPTVLAEAWVSVTRVNKKLSVCGHRGRVSLLYPRVFAR